MTNTYSITSASPTNSNTVPLYPTRIEMSGSISEASVIYMLLEYGYDWYKNDNDSTNPLQQNSWITFTRNSRVEWQGWVQDIHDIQGENGEQIIEVIALDLIAKLSKNIASYGGDPIFTLSTPSVAITDHGLKKATAIGATAFPFFPDPTDTDPWIPKASCNQTTLYVDGVGGNLTAIATTIMASTNNEGLLPVGIIRIDDEWIQYDGYDTYSGSGGRYRFKNCVRGALGTTGAVHTEAATIYQRVLQKIHPIAPVVIEGELTGTADWESIPAGIYTLQPEEGRFDFTYDVLNFPAGASTYDDLRASYAVFDEDHASAVDVREILYDVLTESRDYLGPGLTDG